VCSMRLARRTWGIYPTTLPEVCRFLKLPVQHHDPGADAEACAGIVISAMQERRDRSLVVQDYASQEKRDFG